MEQQFWVGGGEEVLVRVIWQIIFPSTGGYLLDYR